MILQNNHNELILKIESFIYLKFNSLNNNEDIEFYDMLIKEYIKLNDIIKRLETDEIQKHKELSYWIDKFNNFFDEYKENQYIKDFLNSIEKETFKHIFFQQLLIFENNLDVEENIVNIDRDEIDIIIELAKEYISEFNSLIYYQNNPFTKIDGIIIPEKKIFKNEKEFLNNLYYYCMMIFNKYLIMIKPYNNLFKSEEIVLSELLSKYKNEVDNFKFNIEQTNDIITSLEFYNFVETLKAPIIDTEHQLLNNNINNNIKLNKEYIELFNNRTILFDDIAEHNLYKLEYNKYNYRFALEQLQYYINLSIQGDTTTFSMRIDKMIFNNIRELVEYIIQQAIILKEPIIYEYEINELLVVKKYEFYQHNIFLNDFKKFYYELNIVENVNVIDIETIGGSSMEIERDMFLKVKNKYNKICNYDTTFMNIIEYNDYYENIKKIQLELKQVAMIFFNKLILEGNPIYRTSIEDYYLNFLNILKTDLEEFKNHTQLLFDTTEKNSLYIETLEIINVLKLLITDIDNILYDTSDNVLLEMNGIISPIFDIFKKEYVTYIELFKQSSYINIKNRYEIFLEKNSKQYDILLKYKQLFNKSIEFIDTYINIDEEYYKTTMSIIDQNIVDVYDTLEKLFDSQSYIVITSDIKLYLTLLYNTIIDFDNIHIENLKTELKIKKLIVDYQMKHLFYIYYIFKILKIKYTKLQLLVPNYESDELYIKYKDELDIQSNVSNITKNIILLKKNIHILKNTIYHKNITIEEQKKVNYDIKLYEEILQFNEVMTPKILSYHKIIEEIIYTFKFNQCSKIFNNNLLERKKDWEFLINHNDIPIIEEKILNHINYVIGNAPLIINLKTSSDLPNINWKLVSNPEIKYGSTTTYYFDSPGKYTIICSNNEEIRTINIEVSKSIRPSYIHRDNSVLIPFKEYNKDYIKLAWFDEDTQTEHYDEYKITYNDDNNSILSMIDNGIITFDNVNEHKEYHNTIMFFGWQGNIPTVPMDQTLNYTYDTLVLSEYIFGFRMTNPFAGNVVLTYDNIPHIEYITKIPNNIKLKDINDIALIENIVHETSIQVTIGDNIIIKNKFGKYVIVSIINITTDSTIEANKMEIEYYTNSSNIYKYDFSYKETVINVDELIFGDSIDDFNRLVTNLTLLNTEQEKLKRLNTDLETRSLIQSDINLILSQLTKSNIYNELVLIKQQKNKIQQYYTDLLQSKKGYNEIDINYNIFDFDFEFFEKLNENIISLKDRVLISPTHSHYNDIFDLSIILMVFDDYIILLDMYIKLFNYNNNNIEYYISIIKNLSFFTIDINYSLIDDSHFILNINDIQYKHLEYKDVIIELSLLIRDYMYKIKLLFDLKIHTEELIETDAIYNIDIDNGMTIDDTNMYLYYKKIDSLYNVSLNSDKELMLTNEINILSYDLFGSTLSNEDINKLNKEIQFIENKAITVYDSFFKFSEWIAILKQQ